MPYFNPAYKARNPGDLDKYYLAIKDYVPKTNYIDKTQLRYTQFINVIIKSCLHIDFENRITFKEIIDFIENKIKQS